MCWVGCINKEDGISETHDIEKAILKAQNACGQASMPWLYELLAKAEEDRLSMAHNGSYIGFVSLVTYQNKRVFYTNFMSMVGGGRMFHLFDCQGNQFDASSTVTADPAYFPNEAQKKENIIYSSAPLDFFD